MQLAHRAALNGVQLDEIDPRIIIKGIEGGAGSMAVSTASAGRGDGSRITSRRREAVEVAVRFSMNIRRNAMEEREAVLEAVNSWAAGAAGGGILTIGYKPDRMLRIDEVVTPGEGDLWKRFDEYTITFRARAIPYWQKEAAVSAATATGTGGSGSIEIAGSAKTRLDAELENMSGAEIANATITVGGKSMAVTDLGLGNGQKLTIDHTVAGGTQVIRIRIGGTSVMARRTDGSADEFEVMPGNIPFSFSAQRACRLTVSGRGRYV